MKKDEKRSTHPLRTEMVSWRAMLEAIPRKNERVEVEARDGNKLRITVELKRPRWLIPPISWVVRLSKTKTLELDGMGRDVWLLCDGRHTVEAIVNEFARQFSLTFHEARVSVSGFLRILIERGLIAMETTQDAS